MKSVLFLPIAVVLYTSSFAQPVSPAVFLDGDVSMDHHERDMAISPNGKEMFYTIQGAGNSFSVLIHRKKKGNRWSAPEVASFSGRFSDLEPAFNHDGSQLFFCSNRSLQGDSIKDSMSLS
jgi:Tol biopolymer transport system component